MFWLYSVGNIPFGSWGPDLTGCDQAMALLFAGLRQYDFMILMIYGMGTDGGSEEFVSSM